MSSKRDARIVRHWLKTPYLYTESKVALFRVKDLLNIGVTAGEDADRAHFSHSTVDLVFDLYLRRKRTLFAPNENEDNLFNNEIDNEFDTPHDFDAASGPFICSILEYLLASDDSEDPTDHLLRNGLHAEFLDADNGAHWAKALQFNSGGFRLALADLIEEEYQESVRGLSPLWLTLDLRNIFNTARPDEAGVAYSSWLKQGNNKGLLDAEDTDEDGGSDEPSHSDDEDEFNAGGPPSDTESAKTWRKSLDHGGDEGDDEDDGNGTEEKDASGEENGSGEDVNEDGSEEDEAEEDGDEEESSDSGSDQREPAPFPDPSIQRPGVRSAPAGSSPGDAEEEPAENVPRHPSSGSTSPDDNSNSESESEGGWATAPEEVVDGSDQESDRYPEADPEIVEDPEANSENDVDDNSINKRAPTHEVDEILSQDPDSLSNPKRNTGSLNKATG
ncbi:hypothetical protein E8E11_003744 [Didymella keratinophila]|nr:hypothetical protein E8E11_003744 [Didymella keratinophila]